MYKYAATIGSEPAVDENRYWEAEYKDIEIKNIYRIFKEIAIDCPLNYNLNLFKEDLTKYKDCETG